MFDHMCQSDPKMTAEIPTIATPRLMLRPLQLSDAGAVQILFPRWEIVQFVTFHGPIRPMAP
jgi:ribosomal-protein-alanine N-acetyltransferase